MNSNLQKQVLNNQPVKQTHSITKYQLNKQKLQANNKISQQLSIIYQKYFKPSTTIKDNPPLFQQIDHGPGQLCPQLFSIQQNCLLISYDAFDRYYPHLFKILKVKKQSPLLSSFSQKRQQHLKQQQIQQLLIAADLILAFNGENDRAWNIKKQYLQYKDNNNKNVLNINWQLGFNSAVCLKNKKSSSYYQYRLCLIQKEIKQILRGDKHNENENDKQQKRSVLIIEIVQKIFLRQHNLINRVLGRYFRNYFCWMYRVKLIKVITQIITESYKDIEDQQQRQTVLHKVIQLQLSNMHKFIQKYCNDYSAYSYIISFINRYIITNNTSNQSNQSNTSNQSNQLKHKQNNNERQQFLNRQLEWIKELQEYCQIAYTQQKHYRHLIMYKTYILSLRQ